MGSGVGNSDKKVRSGRFGKSPITEYISLWLVFPISPALAFYIYPPFLCILFSHSMPQVAFVTITEKNTKLRLT